MQHLAGEWLVQGRSIKFAGDHISDDSIPCLENMLSGMQEADLDLSNAGLGPARNESRRASELINVLTTSASLVSLRLGSSRNKVCWREVLLNVVSQPSHLRRLTLCSRMWFGKSAVELATGLCDCASLNPVTLDRWDETDVLTFLGAVTLPRQGLQRLTLTGMSISAHGVSIFEQQLAAAETTSGLKLVLSSRSDGVWRGDMVATTDTSGARREHGADIAPEILHATVNASLAAILAQLDAEPVDPHEAIIRLHSIKEALPEGDATPLPAFGTPDAGFSPRPRTAPNPPQGQEPLAKRRRTQTLD